MSQLLEAGDRQAVSDNLIPQGPGGDHEFFGQTTGNYSSAVLALPDGNYVVAWVTPPNTDLPFSAEIHFAVFSPSGALVDLDRVAPFLPSFGSGFSTSSPSLAAFDDAGFVMVMWDDSNSDEMPRAVYSVYDADYDQVARFAATPEAGADPSSVHADVAVLDNDTFVGSFVADTISLADPNDYTEIYTRDPAAGTGLIGMDGGVPNATSIAKLGSGYVYVWSEGGSEIYAQIVNGGVAGAAFQINTTTAGEQWINDRSVAELAGGGFVVVWTDAGASADDPDGSVRLRVFDASGNAVRGDMLVNTSKLGAQSQPAVTALADGGFIVSYTSWQNGQTAIVAQRFNETGGKVGGETLIEAGAHAGDVAVLANGDIVFTYTLDGRIYSERFTFGDAPSGLTLSGGADNDFLFGGAGNDMLFGASGNDSITGFDGNDDLRGGEGNDALIGGNGNDLLVGGAGADAFYGGFGRDDVSYHIANTGVEADLLLNRGKSGDAAGDTFDGVENLIGSQFADQLYGDNDVNFLYGLEGNDKIWGHGGDDILIGAAGADVLTGGAGTDATSYHNSNSAVRVVLFDRIGRFGDAEGDRFGSIENIVGSPFNDEIFGDNAANELYGQQGADNLYGYTGNDMLDGGTGDDKLYGQDGNDLLIGGEGQDRLYGGAGADRFYFRGTSDSPAGAPDLIGDFTSAHGDIIDLSGIDADTATGGDQAFSFIDTAAFSGAAGELRYDANLLEADINGDGVADFQIQLNVASLQNGDFLL